jgi:hypothetical protein
MKYAHGITLGAFLPGGIFIGAAAIKIARDEADVLLQEALWDLYVIWFLVSITLVIILPVIIRFANRSSFREFLIYEAGGLFFFSPLWLFFATEISGTSWTDLLIHGISDGLIGPGSNGSIVGIDISNVVLVPFLLLSEILGLVLLRPSFIKNHSAPREITKPKIVEEPTSETEEEIIEKEMPGVAPPSTTVDSVAALREVLIELGTSDPVINLILNSGIGTVTDFVATSPDQLASISGLDRRAAEGLIISVQKKLWFSDI